MKKCKVLVLMLVLCLVMGSMPITFAKAETTTEEAAIDVKDILGIYDGYYLGKDGGETVRRGLILNIVSCDTDHKVYGVADVIPYGTSSGDTVHYYFEGTFDPSTLTLTFQGKNLISGTYQGFSFSEFKMVLNPETKEFKGCVSEDDERVVYLSKSKEATPNGISKDLIKDSWTGYYMGNRGNKKVKRIITFNIKSVKDDSTLGGVAKVEGVPGESDQVELKYNFNGFYNLTTGQIIVRGTDFVTENSDTKNFDFVYFFGTIDKETGEIEGIDGIDDIYPSLTDVKFNVYNDIYVMDVGTKFSKKNENYQVLENDKNKTVAYIGAKDTTKSGINIPATVNAFGVTYKVTEIAQDALKDCTLVKRVNLGANITTIKENAFLNCTSLSSITLKGNSITKIGKGAFTGIADTATFNVPKDKYKSYSKLINKKEVGYKKSWSIKKK